MTPKTRPLNDVETANLTEAARSFAEHLASDAGHRALRLLADTATTGYPTRTSTTTPTGSNQTDDNGHPAQADTPTERAALNQDRAATFAGETFADLRTLHELLLRAHSILEGFSPDRHIPRCGHCGYPLERGRCTTTINGTRCGTEPWACIDCGETDPAKKDGARCMRCKKHKQRNGYSYAGTHQMAEAMDGIIVDGVAHVDGS